VSLGLIRCPNNTRSRRLSIPRGIEGRGAFWRSQMTIDEAVTEWQSKRRHMGCEAAARWFCKRVPGFHLELLHRYTKEGEYFAHMVATNGRIRIDLAPYADKPQEIK